MVKYGKSSNNEYMASRYHNSEFKEERQQLGRAIKSLRQQKKMTQEDLAEYADINVSYLAKIENGYVNTSIRYLIKISRGLKTKVRELFDF